MTVLDAPTITPDQRAALLAQVPTELLIGNWRSAEDGAGFVVEDPATREELLRVANASAADGVAAQMRPWMPPLGGPRCPRASAATSCGAGTRR